MVVVGEGSGVTGGETKEVLDPGDKGDGGSGGGTGVVEELVVWQEQALLQQELVMR